MVAAGATSADEKTDGSHARRLVQQYGHARGGAETIGSLIELNMRQWKPQSNRGIEILGWREEKTDAAVYRVTYGYRETGRDEKILQWAVFLNDFKIVPLTPLSASIQKMALLL